MRNKPSLLFMFLVTQLMTTGTLAGQLFDAHMHYNATHAKQLPPEAVIGILDRNGIARAAVTSNPPQLVKQLQNEAPDHILPVLGVYRNTTDKQEWMKDESLPARLESELQNGGWHAIGELHIFAGDRHSPVFRRIVELAGQHGLPLLLHADPAVIDTLYDMAPAQPVIWAHAGAYPCPDLLADYLQRYPALSVDLSVRDDRIAPDGELRDAWYELILRYPDRFMIGIDTYSPSRWDSYDDVARKIRNWTRELPDDVALAVTYRNAARIFSVKPGENAGSIAPGAAAAENRKNQ